jgi:TusA-related sulfurtransferase
MQYDLCGFVCPLSKMKAIQVINGLAEGETAELMLGDTESLKSVMQELKARGIRPGYRQQGDDRFVLTISR